MTTHTPLTRYRLAQREAQAAAERCPHWDFENDGYDHAPHACCVELERAERALCAARNAVQRAREGLTDQARS